MITVYGMAVSGNCWKVAQILKLTGHAFHWIEVDTTKGETRMPEFLSMNPQGEVPVVQLHDGTVLTQSNAILTHFAEGTIWLPPPGVARTRVMQWLFWEQYSHEPYIAVSRWLIGYLGQREQQAERLRLCAERGRKALGVMQQRLVRHDWLTDEGPTIADIALFAYTHVADEGGFDLAETPAVAAWAARVSGLRGVQRLPALARSSGATMAGSQVK